MAVSTATESMPAGIELEEEYERRRKSRATLARQKVTKYTQYRISAFFLCIYGT